PTLPPATQEQQRRYQTRPRKSPADLVDELRHFDYPSSRFAVYATPEMCRRQLAGARAAGVEQIMFSVSLAADPLETVTLFGERVLPALREKAPSSPGSIKLAQ